MKTITIIVTAIMLTACGTKVATDNRGAADFPTQTASNGVQYKVMSKEALANAKASSGTEKPVPLPKEFRHVDDL